MAQIARIINGKIVELDEHATILLPNETAARESRTNQQTKWRKEILQKNQVDYYKAYPKEAENLSPELRRLLS